MFKKLKSLFGSSEAENEQKVPAQESAPVSPEPAPPETPAAETTPAETAPKEPVAAETAPVEDVHYHVFEPRTIRVSVNYQF